MVEWVYKVGHHRIFEYSLDSEMSFDDEVCVLMIKGNQQYQGILEMPTDERHKFAEILDKMDKTNDGEIR